MRLRWLLDMSLADITRQPVELRGLPILRRLPSSAVVVEVGVLAGTLSRFLLSSHPGLHLVMVDSWAGYDQHPEDYLATGDRHASQSAQQAARSRFSAEMKVKKYAKRVTILPYPSDVAAPKVQDNSCDLVFLDGDHSLSGVYRDLLFWVPKVKPGGYIGGHDYVNPNPKFSFAVKEAVDNYTAIRGLTLEIDDDGTWFCRL